MPAHILMGFRTPVVITKVVFYLVITSVLIIWLAVAYTNLRSAFRQLPIIRPRIGMVSCMIRMIVIALVQLIVIDCMIAGLTDVMVALAAIFGAITSAA
jgi:hypothetical protein